MNLKQKVYTACAALLNNKMAFSKDLLRELTSGADDATKSSAGDKHETGRAMIQLEQEKIGNQLAELENMYNELQKLNGQPASQQVVKGSLIQTNAGYFYLSVGLGKVMVDDIFVFALSPQSPLGTCFLGLHSGAKASFNGKDYEILSLE